MLFFTSPVKGFSLLRQPLRAASRMASTSAKAAPFQLVLIRHGESVWNNENKFTGWYDCALSEKGKKEAAAAGQLLAENKFKFDYAYTSFLKRAIRTLWYVLEETDNMHIPVQTAWQLNERYLMLFATFYDTSFSVVPYLTCTITDTTAHCRDWISSKLSINMAKSRF